MKPGALKAAGLLTTAVLLASWFLFTRCATRPASGLTDFSRSNSVSVILGEGDKEHGNGVEHVYWEEDGRTTAATLDGVPCRVLRLPGRETGYLYFTIDPSFKRKNARNVTIEVEYADPLQGSLGLQFDATGRQKTPEPAYKEASQIVALTGSRTWLTATFQVQNAAFKNAQNSQADFRLWVTPPELYVRRVTVTRARR